MNLLDQLDPLPDMRPPLGMQQRCYRQNGSWVDLPASERQKKEEADICAKVDGEDWRPHTPGFEINGKGQIRTVDYEPPKPPETDIPIPCVVDFDLAAELDKIGYVLADGGTSYAQLRDEFGCLVGTYAVMPKPGHKIPGIELAEPQTQPAPTIGDAQNWADGWIPHTPGDPMPCDGSIKVFRRWRNGKETQSADYARDRDWGENNSEYAITAWKPA